MSRIQIAMFVALTACTVGQGETPVTGTDSGDITYLDTNRDGRIDAIDTNGDGVADYYFDLSTCGGACSQLHPVAFCSNPLIDVDGDGQPDGLDWNCDGVIDVYFTNGGGGGGGSCDVSQSVNGVSHEVSCTNSGGTYSCTCKTNGATVGTCTTTSPNACSLPTGTCCTF
jgi:hypothetical protein